MPPEKNPTATDDRRHPFLLGQPIWWANVSPQKRWAMAICEDEPTEESNKAEPAFRPAPQPDEPSSKELLANYERISRNTMRAHAVSRDPDWLRVGIVCGAGLGKTTNLQWLEADINRMHQGRGKQLAVFVELHDLPRDDDGVRDFLKDKVAKHASYQSAELDVERLLTAGRCTWLLDSLDQADPAPKGQAVGALGSLMEGRYRQCPVWVSGRPYAFRIAREKLGEFSGGTAWQFLRIGQLDEPECRQLLETTHHPGHEHGEMA